MSQDHFVKEPQAQYRNPFLGTPEERKKIREEQLLYARNNDASVLKNTSQR